MTMFNPWGHLTAHLFSPSIPHPLFAIALPPFRFARSPFGVSVRVGGREAGGGQEKVRREKEQKTVTGGKKGVCEE